MEAMGEACNPTGPAAGKSDELGPCGHMSLRKVQGSVQTPSFCPHTREKHTAQIFEEIRQRKFEKRPAGPGAKV